MRTRTALLVLWLGVVAVVGLRADTVNLCNWQSKTPPDPLSGNQGTGSSDTYWFSHISDVDKEDHNNHFVFSIKNHHPTNYLPAEWLRGDGQAQIAFDRIAPDGCGANDFETSLTSQEDSKGRINYGPVKQNPKDAPLYVTVTAKTPSQQPRGPRLRSRIFADLQEVDRKTYRLELEFTTEVEGQQYTYTVVNRGTGTQLFRIPAFSQVWDSLAKVAKLAYQATWTSKDGTFAVKATKETERHVVNVGAVVAFEEKVVSLDVLSEAGKPVATGQITMYLPVVEHNR